ncbi:cysteine synthase [Candidatus Geothermarchaeota archaeon ex4572_27]|nr:MAG: cysteine synthase [Candidatus Geothermarchaeota archaeon ex4572_27]
MRSKSSRALRVYPDVISLLVDGWPTPLVRLRGLSRGGREVWAKLEFYNPFSRSIKDRPAWNMVRRAAEEGTLSHAIYEATSGNTGIALAALSNVLGRRFRAYLPRNTPRATEILLRVLGAEVVRTGFDAIDERFWRMVEDEARRSGATNLNQFVNDANYEVHYEYTARELVGQLRSADISPACVVAGIGTAGHISAISRRLKREFRGVRIVGVQPSRGSYIPGIKRLETGQKWICDAEIDEVVDVSLEEAIRGVVEVARAEGLLVGLSSGAVYHAYKLVAREDGAYILIFPDDIFKYLEYFRGVV